MDDVHRQTPHFDPLAIIEFAVRIRRSGNLEAEHPRILGRLTIQNKVAIVQKRFACVKPLQVPDGADVIPVAMCQEYLPERKTVFQQRPRDLVRVAARIDYRRFSCLFAADYVAIHVERTRRQNTLYHSLNPLASSQR